MLIVGRVFKQWIQRWYWVVGKEYCYDPISDDQFRQISSDRHLSCKSESTNSFNPPKTMSPKRWPENEVLKLPSQSIKSEIACC